MLSTHADVFERDMAGKLVGVKVDGTQFSADTVSADFVDGVTRSLESSGSGDEEG